MMLKNYTPLPRRILSGFLFTAALLTPITAAAYLRPEEVLLSDTYYYAPPTAREAASYQATQSRTSALRRQAEWEEEYARQHPPEPEIAEQEPVHAAAPASGTIDLELLRTIRILERVDARQDILANLWTLPTMHAGAPLSPTGPASIVAATAMLGAMGWTLKSAGRKRGWNRRRL